MKTFITTFVVCWTITSTVPATLQGAEPEFALVKAEECRPRAGLSNFFKKATQKGAEVRIGYLGGSITAQQGWRVKTLAHFQKAYPDAKFTEINAAIGGTGSDLGVCRLQQDVLAQKPDLLFVEFAVNDGGAAPTQIIRCMEGIVRQTWRALPECDICFVYTLTEALSPPMLEGKFQRSASAMESVADHYGIPTIHMGMEVAKLAKAGQLLWKAPLPKDKASQNAAAVPLVFAGDGVHPYTETGHELYLQAIVRSLEPIAEASGEPGAHKLSAPLDPENYEQAKLVPITGAAKLSAGFAKADDKQQPFAKNFAKRLPDLQAATKPGETIRFKFKGVRCALYHVVGPDSGQVTITLDGVKTVRSCFDPYCMYHRLNTLVIGDRLPNTVHEVTIEIHPEMPNKAATLAKIGNKMDKPERFEGTALYPGALLLVGEIVK
ncbi:MAG: acyl-CoA thioesterase [Pirellula sp.]|nr:acyl-CoA thioesterase [Pirellula sp.]